MDPEGNIAIGSEAGKMPMGNTKTLILLAHGSRSAETREEMRDLTAILAKSRPDIQVHGAFLSLLEPDLSQAFREVVKAGSREVSILPLFLFSGKHVAEDIPSQVKALRDSHPEVEVVLLDPIGRHPNFAAFLLKASSRE